jgi:hypothetical protein
MGSVVYKKIINLVSILAIITMVGGNLLVAKTAEAQQTYKSFTTERTNATTDAIAGLAGVVAECLTALIASQVAAWAVNLLSNLASNAVTSGTGGLLALEVPVKDGLIRQKEIGGGPTGAVPSLDGVLYCAANTVLSAVLRSLTEWVKNGANDSPLFIENPGAFFKDLGDQSWGETIQNLVGDEVDLCSDFNISIRAALLLEAEADLEPEKCRLSTILGEDGAVGGGVVDQFVSGDFSKGGWRTWFNLTQVNNPYEAALTTRKAAGAEVQEKINTWDMTLSWGSGWPSFSDEDGLTTTPGSMIETKIENVLGIPYGKLTVADEFNELMTTVINLVVTELISEGVGDIVI